MRRAAHPDPARRWRELAYDREARELTRPPGLTLDSGGSGKGLAADLLARNWKIALGPHADFTVDCGGDIRFGPCCSLAAIVAIVIHGALLLADSWLQPTVGQILIPFTLDYRSFYTGIGIIGAWIAVSVAHMLGAGTDAGEVWLKAPLLASAGMVAVLFALRVTSRPSPGVARTRPSSSSRPKPHGQPTPARPAHR